MDIVPPHTPQDKPHYVYTLAYPDGRVFYIGKGTFRRIDDHEREARRGNNSKKCLIIRQIWASGEAVVKTKLAHFETREEAFQYEIALIFFMDGLANLSRGGAGSPELNEEARRIRSLVMQGHPTSEETRRKISKAHRGMKHSEEARRKIAELKKRQGAMMRGIPRGPLTEEHRRRLSEAKLGRKRGPRSEETRRKISEAQRGKPGTPWSEEHRRKFLEKMVGHPVSEETKAKMRAAKAKTRAERQNERGPTLWDAS